MKYGIALSTIIENMMSPHILTNEEKSCIDGLTGLYCPILHGLRAIVPTKTEDAESGTIEIKLVNKYGEKLKLILNRKDSKVIVEYDEYDKKSWEDYYYVCPFRAVFSTKPSNIKLLEFTFPYGDEEDDIISYHTSEDAEEKEATVDFYTNIARTPTEKLALSPEELTSYEEIGIKPDYSLEVKMSDGECTTDDGKTASIGCTVKKINGRPNPSAEEYENSEYNIHIYCKSIKIDGTFKVDTKRADKTFQTSSMQFNAMIGEIVLDNNKNATISKFIIVLT